MKGSEWQQPGIGSDETAGDKGGAPQSMGDRILGRGEVEQMTGQMLISATHVGPMQHLPDRQAAWTRVGLLRANPVPRVLPALRDI